METSTNFEFYLPSRDGDDIADINQISDNFKIIDEKVASKKDLGDIETALDSIIAIQETLIGGGSK